MISDNDKRKASVGCEKTCVDLMKSNGWKPVKLDDRTNLGYGSPDYLCTKDDSSIALLCECKHVNSLALTEGGISVSNLDKEYLNKNLCATPR